MKVIFLTTFACLRKRLILFISLYGSYLHSMLDTAIIFQSFRTILKISTSDVSFFHKAFVYFCDITVLNFSKKTSFSNIYRNVAILRQNLRTLLPKPTMLCLRFVFLYILFRILSIFIFYCFVFFTIILLICIFVNLLHVFRNIVNLFYIFF